jgi:hypothetical protein
MRSRWLRAVLLLVFAVALLALADRALPRVAARAVLPTGGAQWIWEERRGRNDITPAAFYAVRDFDLQAPPAQARLLATADEEYVLHLNGHRVGSGAWTPGAGLDVYEVGPLLLPGGNRVVVELRSGRGTGGFLASLVDGGSGETLLETDGAWRVVRQHHLGLVRGWLPLGGAEPAFSWGYPPIGRWGRPEPGREKPLFPALVERPVPPAGGRASGPRGAGLLFDWGREVTGYLVLDLPPRDQRGTALLFTGAAPPDAWKEPPAGAVLVAPGARRWMDARPRRFRYVLLLGMKRPAAARVLPLSPRLEARTAAALLTRDGKAKGVFGDLFGIGAPPLRTPVEDEVWSELQGLPGVAGRKDL